MMNLVWSTFFAAFALLTTTAYGEKRKVEICNHGHDDVNFAFGSIGADKPNRSTGWFQVLVGDCIDLTMNTERTYYARAYRVRSIEWLPLSGKDTKNFCVKTNTYDFELPSRDSKEIDPTSEVDCALLEKSTVVQMERWELPEQGKVVIVTPRAKDKEFLFTSNANFEVWVAIAYQKDGTWHSEGWRKLEPKGRMWWKIDAKSQGPVYFRAVAAGGKEWLDVDQPKMDFCVNFRQHFEHFDAHRIPCTGRSQQFASFVKFEECVGVQRVLVNF